MTLKDLLGLGAGERSFFIPAAVLLPVAILAVVLAFAALRLLEVSGGLTPLLVIAVAGSLVVPVSLLAMRVTGSRGR